MNATRPFTVRFTDGTDTWEADGGSRYQVPAPASRADVLQRIQEIVDADGNTTESAIEWRWEDSLGWTACAVHPTNYADECDDPWETSDLTHPWGMVARRLAS